MTHIIEIDGSFGEGGGQILRTSLALSMALQQPVRVVNIRARRPKPGLKRQHLTAVLASAAVCNAKVTGAELNSTALTFIPGSVVPGDYHFDIGSGGSTSLVLQAVLPPLLIASGPSTITVTGGTHNPKAPPFDFLQKSLLPWLEKMGPCFSATLHQPGFLPAGGGAISIAVTPVEKLSPLKLHGTGKVKNVLAKILSCNLDESVAAREKEDLEEMFFIPNGWNKANIQVTADLPASGAGNAVMIELLHDAGSTVCTGFGQRGILARTVCRQAVHFAEQYLRSQAPVDVFLADQLLVPMVLAKGGAFWTGAPSSHTKTCIALLHLLTGTRINTIQETTTRWRIEYPVEKKDKKIASP